MGMDARTVQLRVTLPAALQAYLQTKASKLGLNMSTYVKHLIINDVKDVEYPVYQASPKIEDAYQKAKKAEENNQLVQIDNMNDFLNNL